MAEAECRDEDEADIEISIACHYACVANYLAKNRELRSLLLSLTDSLLLRDFSEKSNNLALVKEQYLNLEEKRRDLAILARLTEKYEGRVK
jgi:hypothetical protein